MDSNASDDQSSINIVADAKSIISHSSSRRAQPAIKDVQKGFPSKRLMALESVKRNAASLGSKPSSDADVVSSSNFDGRSNSAFSKNVQLKVHLEQSSGGHGPEGKDLHR